MRISLTGRVSIEANGSRLDERSFPGRQGRLVFAYLLAEEGRAVPRDELAEVLWGDAPPATWEKALSVLVSKLRALLEECGVDGQAALRSAFGCYQLVLPAGAWIDVAAAREAADRSEAALGTGDIRAAREAAGEAAALARRSFLPGEDGLWIEEKRRELSELLVRALECLADACLATGGAREAVRHAEELTALEPYREGGYRRLMQAHVAAGDSAEALRVYERCRRLLAEELGAYPSAETESIYRDLLRKPSPSDSSPAAPEPAAASTRRIASTSRKPLLVVAAGALLVVIAAGAALQRSLGGEDRIEAAGALALDPESGEVVARVPLGTAPSAVAVGEGSVWVVNADDRTVSQIDAETRTLLRTFSTSATPTDVAVGAGSVWVGNAPSAGNLLPNSITRLDAETGLVVDTIELGVPPRGHLFAVIAGLSRQHIAAADDAVWVINPDLTVSRIDPRSNRVVAHIDNVRAENIAVGEGEVWLTEGDHLAEIDPSVNGVARRIQLDAGGLAGLAVGAGAVWAADPEGGNLWRVETGTSQRKRAIPLGTWIAGVTFGEGAVWVTNEIGDVVHRVDPRTARPRRVNEAPSPRAVDAGDGGVWLTAASPPSEDEALPASICRDAYFGRGKPRRSHRLEPSPSGRRPPMGTADGRRGTARAAAARLRGRRVLGRLPVVRLVDRPVWPRGLLQVRLQREGLLPQSPRRRRGRPVHFSLRLGPDPDHERRQRPARDDQPVQHPRRADGGRRAVPVGHEELLPPRDAEPLRGHRPGRARRRLGHNRVFLLTVREEDYGPLFRDALLRYAGRVGVRIVGSAALDRDAETFGPLVRRIAVRRPEAVVIDGILTETTGALIRELRATLGPDVTLAAPDAFNLPEDLREVAGEAAEGMYVTNYGVPNERLARKGKQFLQSLASARGGDPGPDLAASYGAQIAEILIDAIARSDGTRASVTDEVRQTQIQNGILGDVAFDAKGDLVEGPITILRFTHGAFVVDRVVRVRPPASSR